MRWLWRVALVLVASGRLTAAPLLDQMLEQLRGERYAEAEQSARALFIASGLAGDQEGLGLARYGLGECAFVAGRWAEAREHYRGAATIAKAADDAGGYAYCRYMDGASSLKLGHWQAAHDALQEASAAYEKLADRVVGGRAALMWGHACQQLGLAEECRQASAKAVERLQNTPAVHEWCQAVYQLGIAESALGHDKAAQEQYERGLRAARDGKLDDMIATGLNNLAALAESQGDLAGAEAALREALAIAERLPGQPLRQGYLGNLGRVVAAQGRGEEGLGLLRQAADQAKADGDLSSMAVHLTTMVVVLTELGRIDDALAASDQAETIRREMGDEAGLTVALGNRAMALSSRGQLREALAIYLRAAEMLERLNLREMLATLYNNVGRIYDQQGDLKSALAYFERCYKLGVELERPAIQALAQNNTGLALYNALRGVLPLDKDDHSPSAEEARGLLEKSRAAFSVAADYFRATGRLGWAATALNNMGQIDADLGRLEDAERTLTQAYDLHTQARQLAGQTQALANLGLLAARLGHLDDADRKLAQAVRSAEAMGDLETQAAAQLNLALLDQRRGRGEQAIANAQRAVELTEQRRALVGGGEQQQRQFMAGNSQPFRLLVDLLLAGGQNGAAFAVAERSRARAVLDMMAGGRLSLYDRLPAAETANLRRLEADVAARGVDLTRLAAGDAEAAKLTAARDQLVASREALSSEERRLAARYPEQTTGSGTQPLDAAQATALLPPDTALIEYAVGLDDRYVFTLWAGADGQPRLAAKTLAEPPDGLSDLAGRFRTACANPRRKYRQLGAELYSRLLAPAVEPLPESVKRLVIVADGPLLDCPFHALWDEAKERFVIDRWEIDYASSASLLAASLKLAAQRRTGSGQGGTLVVADPTFAPAAQPAAGAETREAREMRLTPLPGTRAEAEVVTKLMPAPTALLGTAAQERVVKADLPRFRWLHFATHGLLDADQPLYSAIALAAPDQPGEDGFLEARELAQMSLNAELATLSACQSGRGEVQWGEGLIGLPWAFIAARVPSQVVSLWSVDDEVTKELMTRFYRGLAGGGAKGAALRAAALDLRGATLDLPNGEQLKPEHPYYWAPFLLLGDWH